MTYKPDLYFKYLNSTNDIDLNFYYNNELEFKKTLDYTISVHY